LERFLIHDIVILPQNFAENKRRFLRIGDFFGANRPLVKVGGENVLAGGVLILLIIGRKRLRRESGSGCEP
jgi:hypothetical protein